MASKNDIETGGICFNLYQPDGDQVDMGDVDTHISQYKEGVEYRMREEHFWPHYGETFTVGQTGMHTSKAGRCALMYYANAKEDATLAKASGLRDGFLVQFLEDPSDGNQLGRVVYLRREDGKMTPLIKHMRGKILVSGGFVFQRLEDGMNNRSVGSAGVVMEDQDGVADASKIGYSLRIPYDDPDDATRKIWIERVSNVGWEGVYQVNEVHTDGSNEVYVLEVGEYGKSPVTEGGARFEFKRSAELNIVSDIPGFVAGKFDGITVSSHNHQGGALGVALSYECITDASDNRLCRVTNQNMAAALTMDIDQTDLTSLGYFQLGSNTDADTIEYELCLFIAIDGTVGAVENKQVQIIISPTATAAGSMKAVADVVVHGAGTFQFANQRSQASGTGCFASVSIPFVNPGWVQTNIPVPTRGGTYYVYLRSPSGSILTQTFWVDAHVRSWRR